MYPFFLSLINKIFCRSFTLDYQSRNGFSSYYHEQVSETVVDKLYIINWYRCYIVFIIHKTEVLCIVLTLTTLYPFHINNYLLYHSIILIYSQSIKRESLFFLCTRRTIELNCIRIHCKISVQMYISYLSYKKVSYIFFGPIIYLFGRIRVCLDK